MSKDGATRKRHTWDEEDDEKLRRAVLLCEPLKDRVGGKRDMWWGMVAGHTGLPISAGSARARWERLHLQDNLPEKNNGANGDPTLASMQASLEALQEKMEDIESKLDKFISVWGS